MTNPQNQPKSNGLGGAVVEFPQLHGTKPANQWGEPEPLTKQITPSVYPMDSFLVVICGAVREVVQIVKCPAALAANSALSVLATAAQGVANVQAHRGLKPSPLSLYTLVIGESGERKTSSDNFFARVLNDWCAAKVDEMQPELKAYKAELVN